MSQFTIDALSKTYPRGERPAVHKVHLHAEPGELLALVGESGSGKTTLLRLITGLESADSGSITVAGRMVTGPGCHTPPEQRGMGLVFQHHALFPHLTVGGNVTFGIRKQGKAQQKTALDELLTLVGLPGYAKRYPHELSGGERQRIALARALAPKPELLLLDEPFSSLDPQWRQSIRDETRRILKQRGTTAILVTHHTQDAICVADRIAVLHQGILQQVGTPVEIYHHPANQQVAALFGACNFLPAALTPAHPLLRHHEPTTVSTEQGWWIRPEDLELHPTENPLERPWLTGRITQATFLGDHYDVLLQCEASPHHRGPLTLQVHHRGAQPVSIGQVYHISPKPRCGEGAL